MESSRRGRSRRARFCIVDSTLFSAEDFFFRIENPNQYLMAPNMDFLCLQQLHQHSQPARHAAPADGRTRQRRRRRARVRIEHGRAFRARAGSRHAPAIWIRRIYESQLRRKHLLGELCRGTSRRSQRYRCAPRHCRG